MHALPGQDVKRTFSAVSENSARLPRQSTLKAGCQDFSNLKQGFAFSVCADEHQSKLKQTGCLSRAAKWTTRTKGRHRSRS
jgi:hypothetical protein